MKPTARCQAPQIKILIVEDNVSIAAFLTDAFEQAGHKVVGSARSVEESLILIQECTFDVALLDVDLRGVHSGPVALELRKQNIPFVVMTGSTAMMTPAHTGVPIVLKPFKIEDLLEQATRSATKQQQQQQKQQQLYLNRAKNV